MPRTFHIGDGTVMVGNGFPVANPKPAAIREAEKCVDEILGLIHYNTTSLTHKLIKAHRAGMKGENGLAAIGAIVAAANIAQEAYMIAVAQPENVPAIRPKVEL